MQVKVAEWVVIGTRHGIGNNFSMSPIVFCGRANRTPSDIRHLANQMGFAFKFFVSLHWIRVRVREHNEYIVHHRLSRKHLTEN